MGLLSGLIGNASEVDSEEVERFIDSALIVSEYLEAIKEDYIVRFG